MKVFITRYALSTGILEKEADFANGPSTMIVVRENTYSIYYHKPDWYESREEAVIRAEKMREKKIASLNKSIEKLIKMKFQ